jgi:long-chain fatty acid transport protein
MAHPAPVDFKKLHAQRFKIQFSPPPVLALQRTILRWLVIFSAPLALHASALRIGFKDTEAISRGNAFTATADNPSAIYYNPAGLTQINGQAFSATAYFIQLESDYTSPLGATTSLKKEFQPVPQFYYAWSPANTPWAFGLGAYAPFGLSTQWAPSSPLASLATESVLKTYDIAAMAAYEISPELSVGAGPVFHRADATLKRQTPFGEYFFKGTGRAIGYSAGIHYKPTPRHAFGLSYQHQHKITLDGSTGIVGAIPDQPSQGDLQLPEIIIAGYSFRPTPAWNLELNLDWTNWDRVNQFAIRTAPTLPSPAQPFNWRSGFNYDFGITRSFANGLSLSAGYVYAENSVPDSTFTPAVPDVDRHIFSLGGSYKYQHLTLLLGFQYAYSADRTVTGSPSSLFVPGQSSDGTYRSRFQALSTSFIYAF